MTRAEFLETLWGKYLKPAILLFLIVFTSHILIEAISSEGTERNFIFTLAGIAGFVLVIFLFNLILTLASNWLNTVLPDSLLYGFKMTFRVFRVLNLVVSLWVIYQFYMMGNYFGAIITVLFLIKEFRKSPPKPQESRA